jgi:pimeloyl-ACP methyl ester carboxylesterase
VSDGSFRFRTNGRWAWHEAGPEAGDGPALLCLHGIPDTGPAWAGVAEALAPDLRVVAPDLPGFGASAPAPAPASLADIRAVMADMVAALGLPPHFGLAVHDVGGLFGLAWATAEPARVAGLAILNTGPFPDRRWHWGARILRTRGLGGPAIRLMPRRAFRAQVRRASNGNRDDADIDRSFDAFGPTARRSALRLYRLQTPGLLSGLPEAVRRLAGSVPSLVVWGGRDPYLPGHFADRFGAGTIRIHDDLGHWPHCEAPLRVAADLRPVLAGPASG